MIRLFFLSFVFSFGLIGGLWAVEVVSIPPVKAILSYVGVEDIVSIVPPGADPHTFALLPSTMKILSQTHRIWMVNGKLEVERKLLRVIKDVYPGVEVVFLAEGLDVIEGDPHQWISLRNLEIMINNAGKRLKVKVNPIVIQRIRDLDKRFEEIFSRLGTGELLCFHPAWRYFCRDYGLKMVALANSGGEVLGRQVYTVLQGCKAGKYKFIVLEKGFDTSRLSSLFESCPIPSVQFNPLSDDILSEFEAFLTRLEGLI